jgi:hypothetical protein
MRSLQSDGLASREAGSAVAYGAAVRIRRGLSEPRLPFRAWLRRKDASFRQPNLTVYGLGRQAGEGCRRPNATATRLAQTLPRGHGDPIGQV